MKVAIMQPYFFPYIGYFQLIAAVDRFIFLDNVNHIKQGWIHRNRILINHSPAWLSLSLIKASQNRKISEINVNRDKKEDERILKTIMMNYKKAPYFSEVFPLFERIFSRSETNLATFLNQSIVDICEALEISTEFSSSSLHPEFVNHKGEDKILAICKKTNASIYINPPGGTDLYSEQRFSEENISLVFYKPRITPYPQQGGETFSPSLSIVDVLVHNGLTKTRSLIYA